MRPADDSHLMSARDQRPRKLIRARAARSPRGREMLMEVEEAHETRSVEGWTKDSAKVQIGAELLCKSAKVNR